MGNLPPNNNPHPLIKLPLGGNNIFVTINLDLRCGGGGGLPVGGEGARHRGRVGRPVVVLVVVVVVVVVGSSRAACWLLPFHGCYYRDCVLVSMIGTTSVITSSSSSSSSCSSSSSR